MQISHKVALRLSQKKEQKNIYIQQDKDDCQKAQEANDRNIWETYAQKHPVEYALKRLETTRTPHTNV